ncbi:MAG: hypothetical protein IJD92_01235 [Bacilli bacterium]|nr:hypothetical protein [Bacilli bacterium]
MKKLNFKFLKNDKTIIEEDKINCILNNNKVYFNLDGIKYSYTNNIFTKETKEEIISFNFKEEECKITLKENNLSIILSIKVIECNIKEENIHIKYSIETEEETTNEIILEIY